MSPDAPPPEGGGRHDPLEGFFEREEVLGGLPAKRAQTLLYLIESRTADLVERSKEAMQVFLTDGAAEDRHSAFLESFALGREPPLRPSVQDLERHADAWAPLVARNPRVQAALADALARRYRLPRSAVPQIRAALGLDDDDVRAAYERLYGETLERIYVTPTLGERLRWRKAGFARRLETLPPFWTVYALTLTETVGATILGLPIAFAAVGPLAGLVVLLVLGLVNVVTIALMAESLSRSGAIRYGTGFVGRVVLDYLGRAGSAVLSVALFAICFLALMIFYIGVSTTLDDATHVPDLVWVALLFAVGLVYVFRGSLNATVASAIAVGAVNLVLILILSLLALGHLHAESLTYTNVPFLHGRPFEGSVVGLVFGVGFAAYFGHLSVSNCARVVLRRDPSSRSLVWGTVAAQLTAIALYSLFVIAVIGAVSPSHLVGQSGTALTPLAHVVGGSVLVFGTIFVVLGMGMGSVHFSHGLFNIAREWLPVDVRRTVVLPRRSARLILSAPRREDLRLGVAYLGLEGGEPRLAVDVEVEGRTRRLEAEAVRTADVPELDDRSAQLRLDILEADHGRARIRVRTTLRLAYEPSWDSGGVGLGTVLTLSDREAEIVAWLLRRGEASSADAEAALGSGTRSLLASLAGRGVVVESVRDGARLYRARPAARRGGRLPQELARALTGPEEPAPGRVRPLGRAQRLRAALASERGRVILGVAPVAAAFLVTEWLLATDTGSFAGLLGFMGVTTDALLAGVFPVLLLISARRRGDYVPGRIYRLLGNRLLLAFVYVFALGAIFLHGLVVWTQPDERIAALLIGCLVIGLTVVLVRRGAFAPRATVELREDEEVRETTVSAVAAGREVTPDLEMEGPAHAPRRVTLTSDWNGARLSELKVWAHRVDAAGGSQTLPAYVRVETEGGVLERDLSLGQAVVPAGGGPRRVELTLEDASRRGESA